MPFTEPSALGDILFAFLSILFEGAPYILLGTIISGFIDAYLPANAIDRLLPKRPGLALFISGLLGAIFPVCECAVVPVVRRLVQKGLPVSCAITYLLAAPIINPIVFISTYSAFQLEGAPGFESEAGYALFMSLSRIAMAYIISVLVGFVVLRVKRSSILRPSVEAGIVDASAEDSSHNHGLEHDHDHLDHTPALKPVGSGARIVHALRTAMRDFLDTMMYFTVGVAITAVFNTQFNQALLNPVAGNDLLAIPALMVLAFVLSLCSTSDAFIAASMGAAATGVSIFSHASKLAFLVFGPMMDLKLVFMYLTVFRKGFVIRMVFGLFLLVGLVAWVWTQAKGVYG